MLLRPAERCSTTTNASPLSGGIFSKNWRNASIPPAEAPIATRPSGSSRLMTRPRDGGFPPRLDDHGDADGLLQDASKALAYNDNSGELADARERGLLIFQRGTGVGSEKRRSSRDGDRRGGGGYIARFRRNTDHHLDARRRRAGTCSQVVAEAEGPPMPSPASVLAEQNAIVRVGSGSSGDIG